MIPRKCAKCDKSVYSIEELKCLDKIWHKNCFKCTVCNSLLNMKNYKGFEKQPYCFVHYPHQKHTQVADNPELTRIKENTKIQSNVKYHEDFEKNKGNYTVVADDPEILRIMENSKLISQVKYHEDFDKNIKKKNTSVIDNPEKARIIENERIFSFGEYKNLHNQKHNQNNHYINNSINNTPDLLKNSLIFKNEQVTVGQKQTYEPHQDYKIGLIVDYDLLSAHEYSKNDTNNKEQYLKKSDFSSSQVYIKQQPQQNSIKALASNENNTVKCYNTSHMDETIMNTKDFNQNHFQFNRNKFFLNDNDFLLPNLLHNLNIVKTTVYRAIYDYDAKEDDELTFRDGDKFINCEPIDIGWMLGVHEKTGKHGMFPSNYAEPVDLF